LHPYISHRKDAGVGNRTVNLEIGVLRRVLKRAKLWHRLTDEIKPLPERSNVGRALEEDQKLWLIRVAQHKPEWQIARLAMTLALNTTMRACEIRGLRWRDVDFLGRTIVVRRSKTEAGERLIPLNRAAWASMIELRERSRSLFGDNLSRDWFVFPHAEGFVNPDPSKPMSGWRTAWRRLTRAIECPSCKKLQQPGMACINDECKADIRRVKSPTAGLRFHDLRHHAITELAESQTSEQTIMAIAGHVSARMLAHYSHVRVEAKRKALEGLCSEPREQGGYVTNHGTNSTEGKRENPEVIENMVDVGGLEPPTPCLQSRTRLIPPAYRMLITLYKCYGLA
jgi:integrase